MENDGQAGLLSVRQVAERLGVQTSQVYEIIKCGRLPAIRVDAIWVVTEAALAEYTPRPVGRPKTKGKPRGWPVAKAKTNEEQGEGTREAVPDLPVR